MSTCSVKCTKRTKELIRQVAYTLDLTMSYLLLVSFENLREDLRSGEDVLFKKNEIVKDDRVLMYCDERTKEEIKWISYKMETDMSTFMIVAFLRYRKENFW